MPHGAPIAKMEATAALGAQVTLAGETVVDAVVAARERAEAGSLAFVHPFDDDRFIAGNGTVGLEILEDLPDADAIVAPLGGGGLLAGISAAVFGFNLTGRARYSKASGASKIFAMMVFEYRSLYCAGSNPVSATRNA